MEEKMCDINKVDKRYNGYTDDERNNKYRFQKRWQEKKGYIVKSYKLNGDTIKKLLQFSDENNISQASVLRNAFQAYKEKTTLGKFLQSITPFEDKKYGVKKGFKITQDFADEIESVCKQYGFPYGYFVTKILDDYMAEVNKSKNQSINK